MAIGWHRAIFTAVPLPVPYYAGGVRDTDPTEPELIGYGCTVGHVRAAHSSEVPQRLARFEEALVRSVSSLDGVVAPGEPPAETRQLRGIIDLCAITHGEWIRIHPFANGNGRVARLWVRFILLRYRLPSILPVHPRPDRARYAGCARLAMLGQDGPTAAFFRSLLLEAS